MLRQILNNHPDLGEGAMAVQFVHEYLKEM
jgi:hypothetical protein